MSAFSKPLCAFLLAVVVVAVRSATGDDGISATAARGIAGEITFAYDGEPLCVRANQSLMSSMLVRLSVVPQIGEGHSDGPTRYRLAFLGSVAGDFDLRDELEHCDGRAIDDVPALRVHVFSQLPAQHGTDLFSFDHPQFALTSYYRVLLGGLAVLWAIVPIVVLLRRVLRRAPVELSAAAIPAPTVADQLRPLIDAARRGGLSISEQGRLELLLYMFWRDRLGLGELRPAESIHLLRDDPDARKLLVAVEHWLHAPGPVAPQPEEDLVALLAPYAAAPAIASLAEER